MALPGPINVDRDLNKYLDLPTEEERLNCHREFRFATGGAALAMAICAVCAREFMVVDDGVVWMMLKEIPNRHRLRPLSAAS